MNFPPPRQSRRPGPRHAAALLLAIVTVAPATARDPLALVPADALAVWNSRPASDARAVATDGSLLEALLALAPRAAGQEVDPQRQLYIRIGQLVGRAASHPHAITLLDAQARPTETDPSAPRVHDLKCAFIVQVGDATELLRLIQKAVNEQTHAGLATLESKSAGDFRYQELRDERLPVWCAIGWGTLDGFFVLTVGRDVWPQIARVATGAAPALGADPWIAEERGHLPSVDALEIFVAARRLHERLDPFVMGRAGAFFDAWDARRLERTYWQIARVGRAIDCRAKHQVADETVQRVYADAHDTASRWRRLVPPAAQYGVFDLPVERFLPRLGNGLLATQGDTTRQRVLEIWNEIAAARGLDVDTDLLAHLGPHVVVHNHPPHPLRLPIAVTAVIEIRSDPAAVRATVDGLSAGWQARLAQVVADGGRPPCTIGREDGVWFVRFGVGGPSWLGLAGPAWTCTDRYLILSWSPWALQQYLESARLRE
jgi:hypothetical protein